MGMPKEEKKGIPEYMVSFGDMITLLLTFFILLVTMADRQQAGLVGAGQGPVIKHLMAEGMPGINPGRLREHRMNYKRDMWWIPSQEGDPDQLERVSEKLDRELPTLFKDDEASIHYDKDHLVIRLPARIRFDKAGRPQIGEAVRRVLQVVADATRYRPDRYVRINGHAPRVGTSGKMDMELLDSAKSSALIYQSLLSRGVSARRVSIWAWGSTRPIAPSVPSSAVNRGITIEIFDMKHDKEQGDG